jgi:hypothetical protein
MLCIEDWVAPWLYGSAILWQSHKSIPYKPVFYAEHRRPKTNPIFFRVWGCKGVAGYPPARGHPRGVPLGLVFYALHRRLVAPYSKEYGRAIRHKTAYTYNQSYMVWLSSGLVEEQPRKPYTQGANQSYIPLCGI